MIHTKTLLPVVALMAALFTLSSKAADQAATDDHQSLSRFVGHHTARLTATEEQAVLGALKGDTADPLTTQRIKNVQTLLDQYGLNGEGFKSRLITMAAAEVSTTSPLSLESLPPSPRKRTASVSSASSSQDGSGTSTPGRRRTTPRRSTIVLSEALQSSESWLDTALATLKAPQLNTLILCDDTGTRIDEQAAVARLTKGQPLLAAPTYAHLQQGVSVLNLMLNSPLDEVVSGPVSLKPQGDNDVDGAPFRDLFSHLTAAQPLDLLVGADVVGTLSYTMASDLPQVRSRFDVTDELQEEILASAVHLQSTHLEDATYAAQAIEGLRAIWAWSADWANWFLEVIQDFALGG